MNVDMKGSGVLILIEPGNGCNFDM